MLNYNNLTDEFRPRIYFSLLFHMREIDQFILDQSEPNRSCLLALREIILQYDENISEAWKYRTPFFLYKGKPFCYLLIDKKTKFPYVGICRGVLIEHPELYQGTRSRIKIWQADPTQDIRVKSLKNILKMASELC